jgi:hypothetical protein
MTCKEDITTVAKTELQWLHCDLGDLISPAGLFLLPKLTISLK